MEENRRMEMKEKSWDCGILHMDSIQTTHVYTDYMHINHHKEIFKISNFFSYHEVS